MNARDNFLKALAANEDDTPTRLAYADWLDEQGEHEEADRQRKWPAAKEWLMKFCREHNATYAYRQFPYEVLMQHAYEAVEHLTRPDNKHGSGIGLSDNEPMCDALRANHAEFWSNWSVVTGIPVLKADQDKIGYSCSC